MRWIMLLITATILVILLATHIAGREDKPKDNPPAEKVIIPFDFESKFDNGRYGQLIGDMLWTKLHKKGGFILPEAMQEIREWCQRNQTLPGPDTDLAKMKKIVQEQAGDIAIWGKVERVAGFETDVYDLWITITDFSAAPPRVIYRKNKVRTETVSDIPHTYVKEALEALYGKTETSPPPLDPRIAERWEKGPNLVKGDFEKGKAAPDGWSPLSAHVTWIREKDVTPANRILRFTFPPAVAESTGVLYYSDYFPVEEGALYRFQCRWRTSGSAVKVFVKCYDEVRGQYARAGDPGSTQRREVFRSQQNLKGASGVWNLHTEDFTPTHTHFAPRWGRVMLYAYYPAGTVDWDDVVVKQIQPPPSPRKAKERRPSLETKVSSKELENAK